MGGEWREVRFLDDVGIASTRGGIVGTPLLAELLGAGLSGASGFGEWYGKLELAAVGLSVRTGGDDSRKELRGEW